MTVFRRASSVIRCAFGRDCPTDMETHIPEVSQLREKEIAANTAIAETRLRREAMNRASETIEQMMTVLLESNRRERKRKIDATS